MSLLLILLSFSLFFSFTATSESFEFSRVSKWGPKRYNLAEVEPNGFDTSSSSFTLAAERTYRKDPLDGFKRYTGGYNINDRHYWASVSSTAFPFFILATVWFLVFGLCLSFICICHFCCTRGSYGYSRTAYALSLVFLVFFTAAAMYILIRPCLVGDVKQISCPGVGCVVLYTGQGKFHNSSRNTLDYILNQADITEEKLGNLSDVFSAAKQVGVDNVLLPSNVQTDIDEIEIKIKSSASILSGKTADNSENIKNLLDSVRLALIIIAAVMLALTFLGFLFSIFGMQSVVYILVIIGWILVTGTFILCGIFLLLHNVAEDTCVSMNEWVQNPKANTSLDDILPCVSNDTAQDTLLRTKEVTSQLVDLVNQVITNVSNINFAPAFVPMYYNQSGPLVPLLCNPFMSDYSDRVCTRGEVNLNNATEVWGNYVCQVSDNGTCTTTGRLTPSLYNSMASSVNISYGLNSYGPFLVELQDCTFVRQTFTDIYNDHCPSLERYSERIYIGLVIVSGSVMLSLVFWVVYGRERRHRVYTKQLLAEENHGDKHT